MQTESASSVKEIVKVVLSLIQLLSVEEIKISEELDHFCQIIRLFDKKLDGKLNQYMVLNEIMDILSVQNVPNNIIMQLFIIF